MIRVDWLWDSKQRLGRRRLLKVAEGKPILKKRRKKVVTKVESDCEDQGCSGCCPPSPSRPVA